MKPIYIILFTGNMAETIMKLASKRWERLNDSHGDLNINPQMIRHISTPSSKVKNLKHYMEIHFRLIVLGFVRQN